MIPDYLTHISKSFDSTGHLGDLIAVSALGVLIIVSVLWFFGAKQFKGQPSGSQISIFVVLLIALCLLSVQLLSFL